MKRILAGALAALAASTAVSAEELRVATFNTEFLIREKVHMREGVSDADAASWTAARREQAFEDAVERVAPVVAALDADIVVLTEIGPAADVSSLNAALPAPYPHVAVCECTDTATRQHVAILSRLPFDSVTTAIAGREHYFTELDDPESERDTGISKGLSATVSFSGERIAIYGIHLLSERGGHEGDAQRIAQASIVRRNYLGDLAAGRHVIVAGDLNEKRGDPTLLRIRGLDDIGPDLIQTGAVEFFEPGALGERWTYAFEGERNQIDHVLLSDSFREAVKRGGIDSAVVRVSDPAVSDHSPLVVTIDFRE